MKKRLFSVLLCIIVATFLAACGSGGASSKTVDEKFVSAAAKGLQARWDLSDKNDTEGTSNTADSFIACVDEEQKRNKRYAATPLGVDIITSIDNRNI